MNCSFNIRYKPRTTRAFTKSDLTVYDSAGNTALNALTVYGKSEVVDGSIKSAGEGYAVVDLGTLAWNYVPAQTRFYATLAGAKMPTLQTEIAKILISKYTVISFNSLSTGTQDNAIAGVDTGNAFITIRDTNYTDYLAFKTAMSGVLLCYQLADPTQGNAIAIKTDNGSGIDGTMAVFETGTPLYGVSDTVRDVMQWDGSSGMVTKVCAEIDLGTLTWTYDNEFYTNAITAIKAPELNAKTILCYKYNTVPTSTTTSQLVNKDIMLGRNQRIYIKDTDYTDATAFKNSLNGVKLMYELATPTMQNLTSTENASIAGLRTFAPQTHAQNNAGTEMTVDYTIRVPTI